MISQRKARAWRLQSTSHYLGQGCPRSSSPYGVTRPPWTNHITTNSPSVGNQRQYNDHNVVKLLILERTCLCCIFISHFPTIKLSILYFWEIPDIQLFHLGEIHICYCWDSLLLIFFSCDQAAPRTLLSARLSVLPSATPSPLCSHHDNFRSDPQLQKWCPYKRSRTVNPVLIDIWLPTDAQKIAWKRCPTISRGHPSNVNYTRTKKRRFWPKLGVSGM